MFHVFAFFSVYVDDPSFRPDRILLERVMKLLSTYGIVEKANAPDEGDIERLENGKKLLVDLVPAETFLKFVDNVLGPGSSSVVKITVQVSESSGDFDGRCFAIPTRFYILDACFQGDGILDMHLLEARFMQEYKDLAEQLVNDLGKPVKIATCS